MNCDRALPLVPLYLDGELSDVQADELRPHLLGCPACRTAIHAERALRAWFVPEAPLAVPDGFAARIARRAFAGDRASGDAAPAPALRSGRVPRGVGGGRTELLPFAMRAVAVAALVLIVIAIAIRRLDLPAADLKADTQNWTLEDSLEALTRANQGLEPAPEEPADGSDAASVGRR